MCWYTVGEFGDWPVEQFILKIEKRQQSFLHAPFRPSNHLSLCKTLETLILGIFSCFFFVFNQSFEEFGVLCDKMEYSYSRSHYPPAISPDPGRVHNDEEDMSGIVT